MPATLHTTDTRIPALLGAPGELRLPAGSGHVVAVRPSRPTDGDLIAGLLESLTPEDRRRRFFQAVPVVHDGVVRPLVEVDQATHIAWLALANGRCIGEARLVRDHPGSAAAEVAFSVAGDWHRRGIARLLVEILGVIARIEGIEIFTATVATDNRASAAFLRSLGLTFRWAEGELDADGPPPEWPHAPGSARRLAAIHRSVGRPLARPSAA